MKLLDHAKQSTTDALKTDLKRALEITKVSRTSPQNNLEIITNEPNKEKPKERYIYMPRRKTENYWWSEINIIVW